MTNAALRGKPDAGNPHVRFDEGEVAPAATPRRGSLLYKGLGVNCFCCRALCYDGQVGFMKIDFAEIPRIKKSAFSASKLVP